MHNDAHPTDCRTCTNGKSKLNNVYFCLKKTPRNRALLEICRSSIWRIIIMSEYGHFTSHMTILMVGVCTTYTEYGIIRSGYVTLMSQYGVILLYYMIVIKYAFIRSGYVTFMSKYGVFFIRLQWRPGIGPPHKADHPGIRTTFFQSQIFPHSHNVLSDSESGPTRNSGHGPPFFQSQIIKGLEKRTSKKNSHFYSYICIN